MAFSFSPLLIPLLLHLIHLMTAFSPLPHSLSPNFTASYLQIDNNSNYGTFLATGPFSVRAAMTDTSYLAVVHIISDAVLWSASRDSILPSVNATIRLTATGLYIEDRGGEFVWSTPPFISPVSLLQLQESGNLVLLDRFNRSRSHEDLNQFEVQKGHVCSSKGSSARSEKGQRQLDSVQEGHIKRNCPRYKAEKGKGKDQSHDAAVVVHESDGELMDVHREAQRKGTGILRIGAPKSKKRASFALDLVSGDDLFGVVNTRGGKDPPRMARRLLVGQSLVSAISNRNLSMGDYRFTVTTDDGGGTRWGNSSVVVVQLALRALGVSEFRIAKLDYNGRFSIKNYDSSDYGTFTWVEEFRGPVDDCRIPNICSKIGVCSAMPVPTSSSFQCSCPPGFHVNNQTNKVVCLSMILCHQLVMLVEMVIQTYQLLIWNWEMAWTISQMILASLVCVVSTYPVSRNSLIELEIDGIPGLPVRFGYKELVAATENFKTQIEYLLSLPPHPAWPSLSPPPPSPSSSHHLICPPPLTLSDLLFANLNTSYNYSYLAHNLGAFLFTSDFNAVITNASCLGGGGHPRPIRHNPLVRLPKLPLRCQHPLLRHRYSRPRRRREVRVVTPPLSSPVDLFELQDSGNLVLRDQFVWPVHPTDTIVFGQRDVVMTWNGLTYWTLSMNTSVYKVSNLPASYMVLNETGLYLVGANSSVVVAQLALGVSNFRIAKLEYNGRFSIKNYYSSKWVEEFSGPVDDCRIPYICGKIGVWSAMPMPARSRLQCSCPPGFHVNNQTNEGCSPVSDSYYLPSACNASGNGDLKVPTSYMKLGDDQMGYMKALRVSTSAGPYGKNDSRNQPFPIAGLVVLAVTFIWVPVNHHSTFFLLFALEMHKQRRYLELVDPRLEGQVTSEKEVEKLVRVALCCVHQDPALRPSMVNVVGMLEGGYLVGVPRVEYLSFLPFFGQKRTEVPRIEAHNVQNGLVLVPQANANSNSNSRGSRNSFSYMSSQQVSGPR
ncbi:hypothetical protein C3L33_15241, partial [Rhododendron williamsianum]